MLKLILISTTTKLRKLENGCQVEERETVGRLYDNSHGGVGVMPRKVMLVGQQLEDLDIRLEGMEIKQGVALCTLVGRLPRMGVRK